MAHTRIDAQRDVSAEPAEHVSGFAGPGLRNMRVPIAAADEHRRAAEITGGIPRRARRPDGAAREDKDAAITRGMPYRKLRRQTGALREPGQHDSSLRNPRVFDASDQRAQDRDT